MTSNSKKHNICMSLHSSEARWQDVSCSQRDWRRTEFTRAEGWGLSAVMSICTAVRSDTCLCLSGLLWPVYNWWVKWIRDEFVTVRQPDGDGQSSNLALLIWLRMTTMGMMMPMFLLWPHHASSSSSSSSLLPLLDGKTKMAMPEK